MSEAGKGERISRGHDLPVKASRPFVQRRYPMRPLSRQQEHHIVDALTSLDWMRTQDRKSCEAIREQLKCSWEEAMEVLQYIHLKRNLIRAIDRSDEELPPGVLVPVYGWKWERQSK